MSTILPLNMVLQIILVPVYLLLMFGADVHVDSYESVVLALCTLVIPMLAVLMVRRLSTSSGKTRTLQSVSEENASLGQIIFLCIAVFLMFLSCSSEIIDNAVTLVGCIVPLLVFFISTTVISLGVSSRMRWNFDRSTSLMFTTLARNSPLILAMMSSLFADQPLVLAVLVICPLVELPFLSMMSYLRGRRRGNLNM